MMMVKLHDSKNYILMLRGDNNDKRKYILTVLIKNVHFSQILALINISHETQTQHQSLIDFQIQHLVNGKFFLDRNKI